MLSPAEQNRLAAELSTGRGLLFVRTEDNTEQAQAAQLVRDLFPAPPAELSFDPQLDPTTQLSAAAPNTPAIVAQADPNRLKNGLEQWLRSFNTSRDALRALSVPIVVLASGEILDAIAQRAPDLWNWRGGVYEGEARNTASDPLPHREPTREPRPANRSHLEEAWQNMAPARSASRSPLHQPPPLRQAIGRIAMRLRLQPIGTRVALVGTAGAGLTTAAAALAVRLSDLAGSPVRVSIGGANAPTTREQWWLRFSQALFQAPGATADAWANLEERIGEPLVNQSVPSSGIFILYGDPQPPPPPVPIDPQLEAMSGGVRDATAAIAASLYAVGAPAVLILDIPEAMEDPARTEALSAALDGLSDAPLSVVILARAGSVLESSRWLRTIDAEQLPALDINTASERDALRDVLFQHGLPRETDTGVLSTLVFASGGLLRDLLLLARSAILEALVDGQDRLELRHVERALAQRRNELQRWLSPEHDAGITTFRGGEILAPSTRASLERATFLIRTPDGLRLHPLLAEMYPDPEPGLPDW